MKLIVLLVAVGLCWYVLRPLRVSRPTGGPATEAAPGGGDGGIIRGDDDDCACPRTEVCA